MTPSRLPKYVVIEHPSDVGFDLESETRELLYVDAALTYYDMLVGLTRIASSEERVVEVEGADDEDLMVALLSQCLFMTEVDQLIFSEAHIEEIEGHRLRMRLWGEAIDEARHPFELGIKAITYHDLKVEQKRDGAWYARVVFDI